MRPVNLIPPESRRGQHAPLRSGPLPYIAIGALVAVLIGVTALVLTGNQISERKADVTRLEAEDQVAEARVEKLAAFTQFRTMREQRIATVTSLADSRFDWQRVMRELALIVPRNAWLIELSATASAESKVEGGGGVGGCVSRSRGRRSNSRVARPGRKRSPVSSPTSRTSTASPGSRSISSELPDNESAGGAGDASTPANRLPDPQFHRQIRNHRCLRCGAGSGKLERPLAAVGDRTGADHLRRKLLRRRLGRKLRKGLGRRLR